MLRVFEAFSGIGTQRMALRNLGIEHEVVCIAEIDKFAIRSYEAIHGETLNLGDVSKIDPNDVPDHDLFTYSFPCQDISVAGKGKGFKLKSGTRSSLLWECEKIIEAKKPKYLLMENVKALIFKKFKPGFEKWLKLLEELGYTNYWQVLNAKDYGIPQNRERVFCVSILGTHEPYVFPKPIPLEKRLKDLLEDEVDERFYINSEKANELLAKLNHQLPNQETSYCIDANYHKGTTIEQFVNKNRRQLVRENLPNPQIMQVGNIVKRGLEPKIVASRGRNPDNPSDRTTGSPTEQRLEVNQKGTSNTITTVQKDDYVLEPSDKPKLVGGIGEKNFGKQYRQGNRIYDSEAVAMCLNAQPVGNAGGYSYLYKTDYRIRKLTPKECWRLMGISDEDFEKAQEVSSNTQLYKQAGNAIVVDVLEGIFRKLFLSKSKEKGNKLEEQLEWLDELLVK